MSVTAGDRQGAAHRLTELVQELLDAHADTVCLADDLPAGLTWQAHIEYVKDLQRVGKRALAELAGGRTGRAGG